jgi:NADH:ubiquinone oxidoreductase subunit H
MRYETIFGRIILPGIGTAIAGLGIALAVIRPLNDFAQGPFWLISKVLLSLLIYIWLRGTLPRLRYDQLMGFGWKVLLPVSIANVVITSAVMFWRMPR